MLELRTDIEIDSAGRARVGSPHRLRPVPGLEPVHPTDPAGTRRSARDSMCSSERRDPRDEVPTHRDEGRPEPRTPMARPLGSPSTFDGEHIFQIEPLGPTAHPVHSTGAIPRFARPADGSQPQPRRCRGFEEMNHALKRGSLFRPKVASEPESLRHRPRLARRGRLRTTTFICVRASKASRPRRHSRKQAALRFC